MAKVAIITESQKNYLLGKKYDGISYFNPVQDCNGNWVISKEEIDGCNTEDKAFLDSLTIQDYCFPTVSINGQIEDDLYLGN